MLEVKEIMRRMDDVPYGVLCDYLNENLSCEEYEKFVHESLQCMNTHDPKGFRIKYIIEKVLYGDYDEIIKFINVYGRN